MQFCGSSIPAQLHSFFVVLVGVLVVVPVLVLAAVPLDNLAVDLLVFLAVVVIVLLPVVVSVFRMSRFPLAVAHVMS